MGYNSTVVVMNDALRSIAEDPAFGKKLADAIIHLAVDPRPQDVSALSHCNAATAIESHHADGTVLVAVGQNYGRVLSDPEDTDPVDLVVLMNVAERLGYRLVKKSTPNKR